MKAHTCALKHSQLHVPHEISEAKQCVGVGNPKVVTGEESNAPSAIKNISEVGFQKRNAAHQREGNGDIHSGRTIEMTDQVRQQWVNITSSNKSASVRNAAYPRLGR